MIAHDRSEKRAREILKYYVESITLEFQEHIESILLVGSLSNGSYIEGIGRDIDIITVLKDDSTEEIRESILTRTQDIDNIFNNDIPISKTVYKLSDLIRPFIRELVLSIENKHLIEVTTELQRVHESGIHLYGRNIIDELPVPEREEVIYFNRLGRQWSEEEVRKYPEINDMLNNPPINILIQIVITNAFRHYYYATNKSCSNKSLIATRMREDVSNYRFQRALDIAVVHKINPMEELKLNELEELKKGYEELREWIETSPVEAVPLL